MKNRFVRFFFYGENTDSTTMFFRRLGIIVKKGVDIMHERSGIVLMKEDELALIKRVKNGRTYYTFPGGKVEWGETLEQAAVREAKEELGLDVAVGRCLIKVPYEGTQYYFEAVATGGDFGTGQGEEFVHSDPNNMYEAVWLPRTQLLQHTIIPHEVVTYLLEVYGHE